ncbi:ribonuclease HII [Desulfitobacterium metallireducens]|uniref:Ribonuclease HII n=1 Tax=Desulfitobacterium metallireducens DSM 15288 TaxID=871968 RepID=W0E9M2_9FIRM|nr:ribonuclease HII [Desulfitobacterium metallireducens]AHF07570.1 ribonuclease HII [Desulfitobacterium metallireducens DSM 15288]
MKQLSQLSIREVEDIMKSEPSEEFLELCVQDSREGIRRLVARHRKHDLAQRAEKQRIEGLLAEEKGLWEKGFLYVAGIDEVGRGPLAGPVMAAACILPARFDLPGLNDSKKLSESRREKLFEQIKSQALGYAIGSAESAEIDVLNILQATKLAMKRAVEDLRIRPQFLLIDALELTQIKIPQKGIIRGDSLSASIAAASILAKVTRDRWMVELHKIYPEYGFDRNKGYGTKEHLEALKVYGPCPIHRRSFSPVEEKTSVS